MSAETGLLTRDSKGKGRDVDREQIAREVLAAIGGKENVVANDICMTRLRILTKDPSLVNTEQLSSARGVLGFVRRGDNGIEVVFSPGKVEAVHEAIVRLTGMEGDEGAFAQIGSKPESTRIRVHISQNPLLDAARIQSDREAEDSKGGDSVDDLVSLLDTFSCLVQGLIPYGAQMLIAAGLAGVSPLSIIGTLYYPFCMGLCALLAILLRYPHRYS